VTDFVIHVWFEAMFGRERAACSGAVPDGRPCIIYVLADLVKDITFPFTNSLLSRAETERFELNPSTNSQNFLPRPESD